MSANAKAVQSAAIEQRGVLQIGRVDVHQLDLHGPVRELGDGSSGRAGFRNRFRRGGAGDALGHLAGTAAEEGRLGRGRCRGRCGVALGRSHAGGDGRFVVVAGIALDDFDRAGGTGGQAVAESVAIGVGHELGLAVHHLQGAFVAGVDAQAAAVAEGFIDRNNFPFHAISSWVLSSERARLARVVCFICLNRRAFSCAIRRPMPQAQPLQMAGSSRQRWAGSGSPPAAW